MSLVSHLADLKLKHLLEIRRLTDEQQVKGPAPAEVGHDDGVDGHGREELPSRECEISAERRESSGPYAAVCF